MVVLLVYLKNLGEDKVKKSPPTSSRNFIVLAHKFSLFQVDFCIWCKIRVRWVFTFYTFSITIETMISTELLVIFYQELRYQIC